MPVFTSFDEAWQWFESEGEIVVADDTWADAWARGRAQYLAFVALVDDARTLEVVERAQEQLAHVPGVAPFSREYLHVALAEVGFQVVKPVRPDEVTRDRALQLGALAAPLFQRTPAVTFAVGPVNVLGEAIALELRDDGAWAALRAALAETLGLNLAPTLPHLTVARCVEPPDIEALRSTLRALRAQPAEVPFTVRSVEFVRAWLVGDFPREEPELETLRRYGLRGSSHEQGA